MIGRNGGAVAHVGNASKTKTVSACLIALLRLGHSAVPDNLEQRVRGRRLGTAHGRGSERPSWLDASGGDRTCWLGREDSNLCIRIKWQQIVLRTPQQARWTMQAE